MSTQRPTPEGYSTLEVIPNSNDAPKEVVHDSNAPEVFQLHGATPGAGYVTVEDASLPNRPAQRSRGLSRRTLIIIAVVAFVIVAAIVGGVVGGVVGGRHRSTDSSDSASPSSTASPGATSNKNVLSTSKIGASNYTDADGYLHRSVFFQDATQAVIGRFWDSQNKTWETLNLTQKLPNFNVLPGTPITSSSLDLNSSRVYTWCLLADNAIHGYVWNGNGGHPLYGTWQDDTKLSASPQTALAGSSLASAWERPSISNTTSIGSWILVFQNPTNEIQIVNYTTTSADLVAIQANAVASKTPLAITSELTGSYLERLSLTYQTNDIVLKSGFTSAAAAWSTSEDTTTNIFSSLPSASSVQLATTSFANWKQILFLALLPDGTVLGNWYNKGFHNITITFSGGPDVNFSAMATTSDAMFYGVFNDTILEYSVNTTDPQTFNYVGVVFP